MKKNFLVVCFVLVFSLVFSLGLSGCGNQPGTDKGNQTTKAENDSKSESVTIGWVANFLAHEFYQKARVGMEDKAKEYGVKLDVVDGNMDSNTQVTAAENLVAKKVNAMMVTPVDSNSLQSVVNVAIKAGVPVIAEAMQAEGAKTMIGFDFVFLGESMGKWIGKYLADKGIEGTILFVGFPGYEECVKEAEGFKSGIAATGAKYRIIEIDGEGMKEKAVQKATDAITANPDINVIIGINDDSTLGAVQAYKSAGKDLTKLVSMSKGLEGDAGASAMMEEGILTAAIGEFPELYGAAMVEAAYKAYKGEELPAVYMVPKAIITKENFMDFYSKKEDGKYYLDLEKCKNPNLQWLKK